MKCKICGYQVSYTRSGELPVDALQRHVREEHSDDSSTSSNGAEGCEAGYVGEDGEKS